MMRQKMTWTLLLMGLCLFLLSFSTKTTDITALGASNNSNDSQIVESIQAEIDSCNNLLKYVHANWPKNQPQEGQVVSAINLLIHNVLEKTLKEAEKGNYDEAFRLYLERMGKLDLGQITTVLPEVLPDSQTFVDEISDNIGLIYEDLSTSVPEGEPVWTFPTDGDVTWSSPVILGDRIYFGSNQLYCADLGGNLVWSMNLGNAIQSCPAVVDNKLYVGTLGNTFHCIDVSGSPTEVWKYVAGGAIQSSPVVYNGVVYFGCEDQKVYGLDIADGSVKFEYLTGGIIRVSSPAIYNDRLYIGSFDNFFYCIGLDGVLKWKYFIGSNPVNYTTPTLGDGKVFIGGYPARAGESFVCLDAQTGIKEWSVVTGYGVAISPAYYENTTTSEKYIIFSDDDKNFYCYKTDGSHMWTKPMGDWLNSSPAVLNNRIYFTTYSGLFYCLDVVTGNELWNRPMGGVSYWSSPAIANNLAVVCSDKSLFCVSASQSNSMGKDWPMFCQNARRTNSYYEEAPPSTDIVVTITSPEDGKYICSAQPSIGGTAYSPAGISEVQVRLNSDTVWHPAITSDNWLHWSIQLTLQDGDNTIYAKGIGFEGNEVYTSVTVHVNLLPENRATKWSIGSPDIEYVLSTNVTYAQDSDGNHKVLFVGGKTNYVDTKLFCYDANPDVSPVAPIWTYPVGKSFSSPVIVGDKVFVAGIASFYCLDLKTGNKIWQAWSNNPANVFSGFGYRSPVYVNGENGEPDKIYVGTFTAGVGGVGAPSLFCVYANTGEIIWKYKSLTAVNQWYDFVDVTYSASTKLLYSISYRPPARVFCFDTTNIDPANPAPMWTDDFPATNPYFGGGGLIVSGGKVFASGHPGLYCYVDQNTKNMLWTTNVFGIASTSIFAPPVVYKDHVYVKTGGAWIRRYHIETGEVDQQWQPILVGWTGYNDFAISNGLLFVGQNPVVGTAGNVKLQCYSIYCNEHGGPNKGLFWESDCGQFGYYYNDLHGGPAIVTNINGHSYVYAATYKGQFFCVASPETDDGEPWIMHSLDFFHTGTALDANASNQ